MSEVCAPADENDDSEISARDRMRGLLKGLEDEGFIEYGSTIPGYVVHDLLGIKYPLVGTREVFNRLALIELAAIDYCRNALLSRGMYMAGATNGGYRILLPSENQTQIASYMRSADRKLQRALKLNRATPREAQSESPDQTDARITLKLEGIPRDYGAGSIIPPSPMPSGMRPQFN